jgi:hypothetical protein
VNFITKIFNSKGGTTPINPPMATALGLPPGQATPSGAGETLEKLNEAAGALAKEYPLPVNVEAADPFEAKYGFLRNSADMIQPIAIREILRRCDLDDFRKETLAKLEPIWKLEKELHAEIAELTHDSVRFRIDALHRENETHVKAGRHDAIVAVPAKSKMLEEIESERSKKRSQLRANANLAHPILQAYCAKLGEAAKEVVGELEREEKARCETWGVTNPPSAQIRLCAWASLEGFSRLGEHLGPTTTRLHILF